MISSIVLVLALVTGATQAQSGQPAEITISLTVPEIMEDQFANQIIPQFEDEHPEIRVYLVGTSNYGEMFNPGDDVEIYLDAVEDYVSSADVVLVASPTINSEATRARYFLDLAPLVNSDPTLNSDDFYPAVWQSFQWDGGVWAIPVSVDVTLLFYDPAVFDAAGLAYPNENWTIVDLDYAARALTQWNANGSTARPGLLNYAGDWGALFLSMLGQGVYDNGIIPTTPSFDNPNLEALLTTWAQWAADGVLSMPMNDASFDPNSAPLKLSRGAIGWMPVFQPDEEDQRFMYPALLPGGRAGLIVDAYAVSAGTLYPQEAYELVKFLTNNPETIHTFQGVSARISWQGIHSTNTAGSGGEEEFFQEIMAPELEAMIESVVPSGIATGEALFAANLPQVVTHMRQNNLDARTALDEMEEAILDRLAAADARRETTEITVAQPPDMAELQAGEARLNFGIAVFTSPLPNRAEWERVAADFAASDPEVGQVILDETFPDNLWQVATTYDCFYMENNIVPYMALSVLLSLDPLLNSDPTFDPNDMIGNVMQLVRRNDQTWAMPLAIRPRLMRYNTDLFTQAGAYPPTDGTWTVDRFEDSLRMLKSYLGAEEIPYQLSSWDNSSLLMLIAAYGGLPLNYRTDPPTVNFTDPNAVAAIQRVLDLARGGYLSYLALSGERNYAALEIANAETAALYDVTMGGYGDRSTMGATGSATQSTGLTTFPTGSLYSPLSFELTAAYISANTQYPDACYRFISVIAQSPELITAVPARRSLINSYEVLVTQGEGNVAFYNALDQTMQQSGTVIFPSLQLGGGEESAGIGNLMVSYWLDRAFDRYVLEDADLATELADAEAFTRAYQECVAALSPSSDYFWQVTDCATQVDPTASLDQ